MPDDMPSTSYLYVNHAVCANGREKLLLLQQLNNTTARWHQPQHLPLSSPLLHSLHSFLHSLRSVASRSSHTEYRLQGKRRQAVQWLDSITANWLGLPLQSVDPIPTENTRESPQIPYTHGTLSFLLMPCVVLFCCTVLLFV